MGNLIGGHPEHVRDNTEPGLPLVLMPEEVRHVVNLKIATVGEQKFNFNSDFEIKLENLTQKLNKEKCEQLLAERRQQIEENFEKIFKGKLAKQKEKEPNVNFEDAGVFESFREKIRIELQSSIKEESITGEVDSLFRFFVESPFEDLKATIEYPLPPLVTNLDSLKMSTFEHFWNAGYFLTCGVKFGAHFLAYDHDPRLFHAKFIIVCLESLQHFESMLQAYGRLGKNVRKNVIISFFNNQKQLKFKQLIWKQLE